MSAGRFIRVNYELDNDDITLIQIQPETESLTIGAQTNSAVVGARNPNLPFATVSKGRRTSGIHARLVRIRFTDTPPAGYDDRGIITLPLINKAIYILASRGSVGTYTLGGSSYQVEVVGRTGEQVN